MKMRVHELAKELKKPSKEIIDKMRELNLSVSNHMSTIDSEAIKTVRDAFSKKAAPVKKVSEKKPVEKMTAKKEVPKKEKVEEKKTPVDKKQETVSKVQNEQTKVQKEAPAKKSRPDNKSDKFEKKDNKSESDNKFDNKSKKKKFDNKDKFQNNQDRQGKKKKNKPMRKTKTQLKKERKAEAEAEKMNEAAEISLPITVKEFSEQLNIPLNQVMTKLIGLGAMVTQNESLDEDIVILLADELGREIEIKEPEEEASIEEQFDLNFEDDDKNLQTRPPVVTVMGHVDHGKTSLLDAIKSTRVTAGEAGGITQHIGAYMVNAHDKKITFLDTPGHEAFTKMRLRGAQATDIAILVVAADDGVMPQTIEAISHAKAADVPIIVAINKMDKPEANPDRVKQELVENGLIPEDWGGDTITANVSAKANQGIDELLDMVILVSEILELKANPNRKAIGTVIDSKLDKGKGPLATVLVQNGTLRSGDALASGTSSGRIRSMVDDKGKEIKKAGPSVPVEIQGLSEVPNAGDTIYAFDDEKEAREFSEKHREQLRETQLKSSYKVSLDDLFERIKEGEVKDLNILIKADVHGSIEALSQSLLKLNTDDVKINIVHSGVGGISESDVNLASASNALIIGFNVRPNNNALELSKSEEVDVRTYRIIYDAINDIEAAVKGMHAPEYVEQDLGRAEVRETFRLPNGNTIAGVYVTSGKIVRNGKIKVLRDDIVIYDGDISSLKRFKDDVKEVNSGYEGGMGIEDFNDIKIGDILESYIMAEVER
ncbi:MAG: translation initiation factor IF-2 [Tissierellia bacterium]|nr:translation initiation factor IF-2 [Tissierellia bacterium]